MRHVLLQTREQAQSALDRIKGGEPFEAVAKAVSADTGSRERGGDLGWSLPGHFVEPFAEAMKGLAPGGLVEQPVLTRFGWHVLEVTRVRPRVVPPYDQVKDRIRETLQRLCVHPTRRRLQSLAQLRRQVPQHAIPRRMSNPMRFDRRRYDASPH